VARLLDELGNAPDGLGVSDVARRLAVHRSTASRLLGTLATSSLVARDPTTSRYRLGPRLVGLAATAVATMPVVSQARPELERLSAATSETVNLAILDGTHVVYVDQVAPGTGAVMASWVGRRSPAHASSSGKVLVAFGDAGTRRAVLRSRLDRLTDRTITDPSALGRILDDVRRRGYATSDGELQPGLVTVAAPVVVDDRPVAAVSLSGPGSRIPARELPRLGRRVVEAAGAVARRMLGRTDRRPDVA
jgi:DNA-binding IclR family transcriptional regulator